MQRVWSNAQIDQMHLTIEPCFSHMLQKVCVMSGNLLLCKITASVCVLTVE